MSQQFPTAVPTYQNTSGTEVLGSMGSGLGLARILNDYGLDIAGIATKLGSGASTPSAGKVLRSTSNGVSVWGAVVLTSDVSGILPTANGGTSLSALGSGVVTFLGNAIAANTRTFLATPTSANLAAAVSDETGSGALVFATSPTIVTPTIASFANAAHNHSNAAGGGDITKVAYDLLATLSNPYKFSVKVAANYATAAGFLKIQFNSELFDTNNNFDSTTNYRYVAPVDGFYQFNALVDTNSNAGGGTFYGSVIRHTTAIGAVVTEYLGNGEVNTYASTFTHRSQASHLIQLAAGDFVEVIASLAVGTVGETSRFSGFLMCRT